MDIVNLPLLKSNFQDRNIYYYNWGGWTLVYFRNICLHRVWTDALTVLFFHWILSSREKKWKERAVHLPLLTWRFYPLLSEWLPQCNREGSLAFLPTPSCLPLSLRHRHLRQVLQDWATELYLLQDILDSVITKIPLSHELHLYRKNLCLTRSCEGVLSGTRRSTSRSPS